MRERVAGLVLAGGEARRLGGGDKPMLPLGTEPMLARILSALDPLSVAISANGDPSRFRSFGRPVLPDGPFLGQGPLVGILAGMEWAAAIGAELLLSAPGDTPFLPHGLPEMLVPAPGCAASGGRRHHLVALWPVTARAALRNWLLASGSRSVGQFAASIGMRAVDFPIGPLDPFLNINTPQDLAAARGHLTGTN